MQGRRHCARAIDRGTKSSSIRIIAAERALGLCQETLTITWLCRISKDEMKRNGVVPTTGLDCPRARHGSAPHPALVASSELDCLRPTKYQVRQSDAVATATRLRRRPSLRRTWLPFRETSSGYFSLQLLKSGDCSIRVHGLYEQVLNTQAANMSAVCRILQDTAASLTMPQPCSPRSLSQSFKNSLHERIFLAHIACARVLGRSRNGLTKGNQETSSGQVYMS